MRKKISKKMYNTTLRTLIISLRAKTDEIFQNDRFCDFSIYKSFKSFNKFLMASFRDTHIFKLSTEEHFFMDCSITKLVEIS